MRYFVYFSYDGTPYHGWQIQPNGLSVQQVMQEAFSTIFREQVELVAAGRTDAGVHAAEMVAHFNSASPLLSAPQKMSRLVYRLNSLLDRTIAVTDILPVTDEAHARFSAIARTYQYHVITQKDPFLYGRAVLMPSQLDFDAMNNAAKLLLFKGDFGSFCKVHNDAFTMICDVTKAEWTQVDHHHYVFTIRANRFLRNMVRAIVGTLFDVGMHKIDDDDFQHIIEQNYRTAAGSSAPAEGLYLTHIEYPQEIFIL